MRHHVIAALLAAVSLWVPLKVLALDDLAALTDDTIKSACHGYVLHEAVEHLAAWFGSSSPLCQRVNAGEAPRAAITALRQQGITTPPRTGSADFRALPDPIAMECDNDQLCMRERRRARDIGQPLDMATYVRVRSHCENTAHRVYGVAQGVYGCIEQALADWPQLRLARPVRLLPMQGDFEASGILALRDAPVESAAILAQLEVRRPLTALARSEDGRWLHVRDQLSGAEGFVSTTGVQRARATAEKTDLAAAAPPSLDIDTLVRSGQVSRQHQLNDMERLERARREEEARIAAERERQAREQAERERVAALRRQRQQQQAAQQGSGADTFMRGLAGAAVVGLGAAAVGRGVPVDRASEVVAAGITDIMSDGGAGASVRVLEQAHAGAGSSGIPQGTDSGRSAASGKVRPNALQAAGRPRYRDCSMFNNPTGFDALALIRLCNAAEQQYREYERLARSGADSASVQRAWEAHRSTAVDLMVFIDSQATAKRANGF